MYLSELKNLIKHHDRSNKSCFHRIAFFFVKPDPIFILLKNFFMYINAITINCLSNNANDDQIIDNFYPKFLAILNQSNISICSSDINITDFISRWKRDFNHAKQHLEALAEIPNKAERLFSASVLKHNILKTNNCIQDARIQYSTIFKSSKQAPAIIHKLRDHSYLKWENQIREYSLEDLTQSGRIYTSATHCWDINSVWVLAHIHKHHQFMVISPVTVANIICKSNSCHFSAFAKEIAIAMNVGYQITKIEYKHFREIVYLAPTKTLEESQQITIADCRTDDKSCINGIENFLASQHTYRKKECLATTKSMLSDKFANDYLHSAGLLLSTTGLLGTAAIVNAEKLQKKHQKNIKYRINLPQLNLSNNHLRS